MTQENFKAWVKYISDGRNRRFEAPFRIIDHQDIEVRITNRQGDKQLARRYQVQDNISNPNNSGFVIFDRTVPTDWQIFIIYKKEIKRSVQIPAIGHGRIRAIESEFTNTFEHLKLQSAHLQNCLQIPTGDLETLDSLPPHARRASKFLSFDQYGQPIAGMSTSTVNDLHQTQNDHDARIRQNSSNIASNTNAIQQTLSQIQTNTEQVPVGTIIFVHSQNAPRGYLKANGALLLRTNYAELFEAIGVTYNRDDNTATANNFRLPDLRGEFLRGWDDGRRVDLYRRLGTWQKGTLYARQNHRHISGGFSVQPKVYVTDRHLLPGVIGENFDADYIDLNDYQHISELSPPSLRSPSYHSIRRSPEDTLCSSRPRNFAFLACIKY